MSIKQLQLKLSIAVAIILSVVIVTCLLWTPVKVNYYGWHMRSFASPTYYHAVVGLLSSGKKGKYEADKISEDFNKSMSNKIGLVQTSIVPSFVIIILLGTLVNCVIMRLWLVNFFESPSTRLYVSVLVLSLFFFTGIFISEVFLNTSELYYSIGLGGKLLIVIIMGISLGLTGFVSTDWLLNIKNRPTTFHNSILVGTLLNCTLLLFVAVGFLVIGNDFKCM